MQCIEGAACARWSLFYHYSDLQVNALCLQDIIKSVLGQKLILVAQLMEVEGGIDSEKVFLFLRRDVLRKKRDYVGKVPKRRTPVIKKKR